MNCFQRLVINSGRSSLRIVVEARKDRNVRDTLNAIAHECTRLGHKVSRWRGPHSGRVWCSRRLSRCDLAILWNGTHPRYESALLRLTRMRAKILFCELGWFPQVGTFQIDPRGINADASWVSESLDTEPGSPLAVREQGDLLVLLQHESDTQITHHSICFREMATLIDHVCRHTPFPVRVRPHPRFATSEQACQVIERWGCRWDPSATLADSLQTARAVACINSSAAVEALAAGLPVLSFGHAVYRQPGVVYCLDGQDAPTARAFRELASGRCSLSAPRIAAMLRLIQQNQWTIPQLPNRLPALLNEVLSDRTNRDTMSVKWAFAGSA